MVVHVYGARQKQNWFKHPPCAKVRSIGWQKLPGPRSCSERMAIHRQGSKGRTTTKNIESIVLGLIWFLAGC